MEFLKDKVGNINKNKIFNEDVYLFLSIRLYGHTYSYSYTYSYR